MCSIDENVKWCSHWKNSVEVLKKLEIKLSCDPAMPLLGIYSRKKKNEVKILKKCLCYSIIHNSQDMEIILMSIDKCMDKENGIYLTLKEKEIMPFIIIWIDLEDIC